MDWDGGQLCFYMRCSLIFKEGSTVAERCGSDESRGGTCLCEFETMGCVEFDYSRLRRRLRFKV